MFSVLNKANICWLCYFALDIYKEEIRGSMKILVDAWICLAYTSDESKIGFSQESNAFHRFLLKLVAGTVSMKVEDAQKKLLGT